VRARSRAAPRAAARRRCCDTFWSAAVGRPRLRSAPPALARRRRPRRNWQETLVFRHFSGQSRRPTVPRWPGSQLGGHEPCSSSPQGYGLLDFRQLSPRELPRVRVGNDPRLHALRGMPGHPRVEPGQPRVLRAAPSDTATRSCLRSGRDLRACQLRPDSLASRLASPRVPSPHRSGRASAPSPVRTLPRFCESRQEHEGVPLVHLGRRVSRLRRSMQGGLLDVGATGPSPAPPAREARRGH
jgi:hypothetical protein